MSSDPRDDTPVHGPGRTGDEPGEPVVRQWRSLADDEPPELLDRAVLNRARAAVASERPHSSRPWSFGWLHAVTTAAIVVLGMTLVVQLGEPVPGPSPETVPRERSDAPRRVQESEPTAPATAKMTDAVEKAAPRTLMERQEQVVPANADDAAVLDAAPPAPTPGIDEATRSAEEPESVHDPESWLEQIRRLVEEGREAEARRELERFRQTWPEHPVPDDLVP